MEQSKQSAVLKSMANNSFAVLTPMDTNSPVRADVIICSYEDMKRLCEEIGTPHPPRKNNYAGKILNISIWVDDRFDEPVFVSGM